MRLLFLVGALLLAGCGNGGNSSPSPSGIPAPSVGQWVTYGGYEPTVNGNSFAFPCCNGSIVAGYVYTQLPGAPKVGQTLTLNYSVTGNNPVWQQSNGNGGVGNDSNPPTIHLFVWERGDDLQCDTVNGVNYAQFRMFAGRTNLVLGANQTISVPLTPTSWTGCYAAQSTAAQWSSLLNNLLGVGFTFGGQSFAGHGIYLSSGSASFTINSLTVQ